MSKQDKDRAEWLRKFLAHWPKDIPLTTDELLEAYDAGRASAIPWRDPRVERPDGRPIVITLPLLLGPRTWEKYDSHDTADLIGVGGSYCYAEEFPMPKREG